METSFELAIAATLNINKVDWETPFPAVMYSNVFALVGLILVSLLYPLFTVVYYRNFSTLADGQFNKKFGAGLEGTKFKSKQPNKSILAYPVFFYVRRILFAVSAVLLGDFLWV